MSCSGYLTQALLRCFLSLRNHILDGKGNLWRRRGGSNSRAGLLRPTSLANSPLHLLGYSSILNYQAFHLNRGFGRAYVRRLNVLQGLYVSLSIIKKWLSIPTLRIWYHPLLPYCLDLTGIGWSLSYHSNEHNVSSAHLGQYSSLKSSSCATSGSYMLLPSYFTDFHKLYSYIKWWGKL